MPENVDTMIDMARETPRKFIQAECSEEYKEEYKRIIQKEFEALGVHVNPERMQGPHLRGILEEKYPTLKAIAEKERGT